MRKILTQLTVLFLQLVLLGLPRRILHQNINHIYLWNLSIAVIFVQEDPANAMKKEVGQRLKMKKVNYAN